MSLNPKNVQQAVRLAVALANPTLRDQDWQQLKERYHLGEETIVGIKSLIELCSKSPELKPILQCLTFNV